MQLSVALLTCVVALAFGAPAAVALEPTQPLPPAVISVPGTTTTPPVAPNDPLTSVAGLGGSILTGVLGQTGLVPAPAPPAIQDPALTGPAPSEPTGQDKPSAKNPARGVRTWTGIQGAANSVNPFGGLASGGFAGYGTGTVFQTDALLSGKKRASDIELAFSGSAYTSSPLGARQNELARPVAPALAADNGFGRGRTVEIGFNTEGDEANQVQLDGRSEAKAPPSQDLVTKELTDVHLEPLVNADALRAQAAARSATNGCVVGSDLAYGMGSATDAALVAQGEQQAALLSTSAAEPPRGVSQSVSRTRLVPQAGPGAGRFGLVSESRQTIAPVTLFDGTPNEFTVEVAGEWVLRAVSDGKTGSVTFGPDMTEDPERPVLRILDKDGKPLNQVTLDDFIGERGAVIETEVAQIVIGEDPRAIDGNEDSKPTATGTLAAAAVDVVRLVTANEADSGTTNLRVGHMEVGVAVPAGGVPCPGIGMVKESDAASVRPGDHFTWTTTVSNPNDCVLDGVEVVDSIATEPALRYKILSTSPQASIADNSKLTFKDLGSLPPGRSKTLRVEVQVDDDSPLGRFSDEAVATGTCGGAGMVGRVRLDAPDVSRVLAAAAAGGSLLLPRAAAEALARTGGLLAVLPALALLGGGSLLWRLPRRKRGHGAASKAGRYC
jgi:hypothetical protein